MPPSRPCHQGPFLFRSPDTTSCIADTASASLPRHSSIRRTDGDLRFRGGVTSHTHLRVSAVSSNHSPPALTASIGPSFAPFKTLTNGGLPFLTSPCTKSPAIAHSLTPTPATLRPFRAAQGFKRGRRAGAGATNGSEAPEDARRRSTGSSFVRSVQTRSPSLDPL